MTEAVSPGADPAQDSILCITARLSVRADAANYFTPPESCVPSNYKDPVKIASYAAKVSQARQDRIATFPWCLEPEELHVAVSGADGVAAPAIPDSGIGPFFVNWLRETWDRPSSTLYGLGIKQIFQSCLFSALRAGESVPAAWLSASPFQPKFRLVDPLSRLEPGSDISFPAVLQSLGLPVELAELHASGAIVFLPVSQQREYLQAISRLIPPR